MNDLIPTHRILPGLGGLALLALLAACGGDSGAPPSAAGGTTAAGTGYYVVDPNQGGQAQGLVLGDVYWGRLANVEDSVGRLVFTDFVIGPAIGLEADLQNLSQAELDALDWEQLDINPVTGIPTLRLRADVETETALFDEIRTQVENATVSVDPTGVSVTETPPFPVVGRNAALVLPFNDLIDESTIAAQDSVQVFVGTPSTQPFDARVIPDPNHGGIGLDGQFHSTRLIVDFTISAEELQDIDVVVQANETGLPASAGPTNLNAVVRLPSRQAPVLGVFTILTNLKGKSLDASQDPKVDLSSPGADVVRAFRAGNDQDSDPVLGLERGFLIDTGPPTVLGIQAVLVDALEANDAGGPRDFVISYTYATADCAQAPANGDVLSLAAGLRLEVAGDVDQNGDLLDPGGQVIVPVGASVSGVPVRLPADDDLDDLLDLLGDDPQVPNEPNEFIDGQTVEFRTPWRDALGAALAPCFVRFSPAPSGGLTTGVAPESEIIIRFSEPMRRDSVRPVDTFFVGRVAGLDTLTNVSPNQAGSEAPEINELVLGRILATTDSRGFRFVPSLPFSNVNLATPTLNTIAEDYFLNLVSAFGEGVTDLAGNSLADTLPEIQFTVDPAAAPQNTGGWVLRFSSTDEARSRYDPTGDEPEDFEPSVDLSGQYIFDANLDRIVPRPVQRFSLTVDRGKEIILPMTPAGSITPGFVVGTAEPLVSAGARTQHVWRYVDAGLEVNQVDGTFYNLDVERVSLAPITGSVASSIFTDFAVGVGHARNLYDEAFDPIAQVPIFPASGFNATDSFEENYIEGGATIVHPREAGFIVSPANSFQSSQGLALAPMPWNLGIPDDQKTYWTWRDTAIQDRGGVNDNGDLLNWGAPVVNEVNFVALDDIYGGSPRGIGDTYGFGVSGISDEGEIPEGIPTGGLPILLEYRCYPTEQASLNLFDLSLHVPAGLQPFSRAQSSGGTNLAGTLILKDPDSQPSPTGGFAPQPAPTNPPTPPLVTPGTPTPARDPVVYLGQLDVVLRVSRAHTVVVDAENRPSSSITQLTPAFNLDSYQPDYVSIFVEPQPTEQPQGTAVTFAFRGSDRNVIGPTRDQILDGSFLDLYGDVAPGQLALIDENEDGVPDGAVPVQPDVELFDFVGGQLGQEGFTTFVEDLNGVDGLRFVQTRISFISNASSGLSPSLSAFGLSFRR